MEWQAEATATTPSRHWVDPPPPPWTPATIQKMEAPTYCLYFPGTDIKSRMGMVTNQCLTHKKPIALNLARTVHITRLVFCPYHYEQRPHLLLCLAKCSSSCAHARKQLRLPLANPHLVLIAAHMTGCWLIWELQACSTSGQRGHLQVSDSDRPLP